MDVLHDLHADFAQAAREADAAVAKLKATWQALIDHLGVDAAPIVAQAETDAADVADTVKTDAEQLAAAGAGAVESAVTQTITPNPLATQTTPVVPSTVADVTTPPTTSA